MISDFNGYVETTEGNACGGVANILDWWMVFQNS